MVIPLAMRIVTLYSFIYFLAPWSTCLFMCIGENKRSLTVSQVVRSH